MGDCIMCKWDKFNSQGQRMIQCGQGHARTFQKIIEDCHAWEEKEKCWCESPLGYKRLQLHDYIVDQDGLGHYQMRSPENAEFCPRCSRFLGDIK